MSLDANQLLESVPSISTQELKQKTKDICRQYLTKFIPFLFLAVIAFVASFIGGILASFTLGIGQFIIQGPLFALVLLGSRNIILKGELDLNDVAEKIQANIVPIVAVPFLIMLAGLAGLLAFIIGALVVYFLTFLAPHFSSLYNADIGEAFTASKNHMMANRSSILGAILPPVLLTLLLCIVIPAGSYSLMGQEPAAVLSAISVLVGIFYAMIASIYFFTVPLAYCLLLEERLGSGGYQGAMQEPGTGFSDSSGFTTQKPRPMF